ncbi:hypothetical protein B005_4916 [Nocardiopsis alba ATCC BAA-2165]|uniref:Uncharacterized protein n=1 Tax=Nocardiopsis alba (strain ATCC BAA-2165 / BE74) TaxID=1205910 RepID=J7LC27_NOCAA|nr:hypothetical protein B005_4916 [Nocardiopsis alba ATCC BAA-2165]
MEHGGSAFGGARPQPTPRQARHTVMVMDEKPWRGRDT